MRKLGMVLLALSVLAGTPAYAQATGGTTGGTGSTSGAGSTGGAIGTPACDFTAIKDSLFQTESAGSGGYTALYGGGLAAGRYQFIPATRSAYINAHPECNGQNCNSTQAWISQPCWQVQECIMDAFTNDNLQAIRNDPACQQLLANGGQVITGSGQRQTLTCKVTESGLLAAFHLGGRDECRKILANGHGDQDATGTQTAYYACKHGGLAVPGNCAPSPSNTSGEAIGPMGTLSALNFGGGLDLSGPNDPLREWWLPAFQMMAEQFTVNMEMQVEAIGMMFDAKHQLETQRLFQEMTAQAHKDYQPSEQMCTFGTFARDLVATERSANITRDAVAEHILEREVGQGDVAGISKSGETLSRIDHFRKTFCDQNDNGVGLYELCPQSAPQDMRNRDINYTQTLDHPLSLDIDFNNPAVSKDEDAVFALVDNLFATEPLPRTPQDALELRKFDYNYLNLRSVVAMRGIARNSIANIIAMKTATPNQTDQTSNAPYLRALLREFGLTDQEIVKQLGPNPSYYAQMEFLTRKMYQNPLFYSNLYDKPTNVQRIRAAMKAIKLMQDRDIQAALQRREMLLSMLLELRIREKSDDVYDTLEKSMFSSETGSGNANGGSNGQTPAPPNTPVQASP
jgi:hypothetical protein